MSEAFIYEAGDAPKLYYQLLDIYGNLLAIDGADLQELTYSVTKQQDGSVFVPVEGFSKVAIPRTAFSSMGRSFPSTVKGVSSQALTKGYNLVVYPFRAVVEDGSAVWKSPFAEKNATYVLTVDIAYRMFDDALTGTAIIRKSYLKTIKTYA